MIAFPTIRTFTATVAALAWMGVSAAGAQSTIPSGVAGTTPQQAPGEHRHGQAKPAAPDERHPDHAAHQKPGEQKEYPPGIPPITEEDRAAAFPQLEGQHTVHDHAVNYFVLFDQFEWQSGGEGAGFSWDNKGWFGGDINRFWFRTEGEREDRFGHAEAHAFYGRAVARWWDLVVGVRQDFRPDPARTWAAVGIQGLAPYWFEVEATAYLGASGRTHFRLETEYELLLTNRLVLQPLVELQIYGKRDPERGIGAGLSSVDAGLRLRYEFRREFAPYLGVTWSRKLFGTADLARAAGEDTGGARLALGLRLWF